MQTPTTSNTELTRIEYNSYAREARTELRNADSSVDRLKSHAMAILNSANISQEDSDRIKQEIQANPIHTVRDAKRLISKVKRAVNKSPDKATGKQLNDQLSGVFKQFRNDFAGSLKRCNKDITKAEVSSKVLDGKSPLLARISAGVNSFFRRESVDNLSRKITELTRHKPIE